MTRRRLTLAAALAAACLLAAVTALSYHAAATGPKPDNIDRIAFPEPSGIVYHWKRKTLFVVGDNGDICEMKTDGTLVKRGHLGGGARLDLEGITFDPSTGMLYAAVEGEDRILEVDPDTFEKRRSFALPRTFKGKTILKEGGQGIEAITFVPDEKHAEGGTFFVTNQVLRRHAADDLSSLIHVEVPLRTRPGVNTAAKILAYHAMKVVDLSGLCYDRHRKFLYMISDTRDRLMRVTLTGEVQAQTGLPGLNQEGITFDDAGFMYITQDTGGILKIRTTNP